MIKLDILAFGAHPDDVELSASGTLYKHIQQGKKVGIIDLTEGELGSRGDRELRKKEASIAAEILKLDARVNLNLGDGFFEINQDSIIKIIEQIRFFRPEVVLCNAIKDRHPDHARGAELVARACFLSGLIKIETSVNEVKQEAWRPKNVYHYIQDNWIDPSLVIDVTDVFDVKMKSIMAYGSQFYDPNSKEKETPISSPEFLKHIEGRAISFGRLIGSKYGEGFTINKPIATNDILTLK